MSILGIILNKLFGGVQAMIQTQYPRFICQIFRRTSLLWQTEVALSSTTNAGTHIEHASGNRNLYVDVVPYCLKLLKSKQSKAEYPHQLYCVVTKFGEGLELTDDLTIVIERLE